MTWAKHGWASLAGLAAFAVLLVVYGGGLSEQSLAGGLILAAVMSVLFWHYKRKSARKAEVRTAVSAAPFRDDRVIPDEVKSTVALRDRGLCQIKGPGCTKGGTVWDHKVPYSWGGSSKTADNIQQACHACNNWKSDRFADTPSGRISYEEWQRARAA